MSKGQSVINVYRDALANIMKLGGVCWDGSRRCSDSQHVARIALAKLDPAFLRGVDDEPYHKFYVKRDGSFHKKRR